MIVEHPNNDQWNQLLANCLFTYEDMAHINRFPFAGIRVPDGPTIVNFLRRSPKKWLLQNENGGGIIGFMNYGEVIPGHRNALGMVIGRNYSGMGNGKKALREFISRRHEWNIEAVSGYCHRENSSMIRIMIQSGFRRMVEFVDARDANAVRYDYEKLLIRDAGPNDLQFVAMLAGYFNVFGNYVPVFQAMIQNNADVLRQNNVTHQVDMKIAQLDFIDAGFIAVEWTPNVGKIHGIVVGEEHRGKGVGDFLLNEVCAEAVRRNIGLLECLTGEDANPHAMQLFNRNGFENPIRVGTYPRGQRAVRLTKTLQIP